MPTSMCGYTNTTAAMLFLAKSGCMFSDVS